MNINKKTLLLTSILLFITIIGIAFINYHSSQTKYQINQGSDKETYEENTYGYLKENSKCNSLSYSDDYLSNTKWEFIGSQETRVGPATIEFKEDKSFIFKGYKDESFVSSGKWLFDGENRIMTLSFTDNKKYWQERINKDVFSKINEYDPSQENVIDMWSEPDPGMELLVRRSFWASRDGCTAHINFLGYVFNFDIKEKWPER